jgi:hypothetical protein
VRQVMKLSVSALVVAAAWCAWNAGGASAQTFEQTQPSCSSTPAYLPYPYSSYAPTPGIPVACQLSVPDQALPPGATLFVQPTTYAGLDPQSCAGIDGDGYTTQAISNSIPFSYTNQFAGSNACAFEVTAGTVPPGYPVGSFSLSAVSGTVQLQTLICGDPSCGTASNAPYSYYPPAPVYYPPATVYTPPSPTVIYTPPAITYTPPVDQDDGGQGQDPHWQGNGGQWHDPSGSDPGSGQSDDPNHHHDDQGAGSQQSSGSGGSDPHHDDHSAGSQQGSGSGSGNGSGSGSSDPHHDDHGAGSQQGSGGSGSGGSGSDSGHHHHDNGSGN